MSKVKVTQLERVTALHRYSPFYICRRHSKMSATSVRIVGRTVDQSLQASPRLATPTRLACARAVPSTQVVCRPISIDYSSPEKL